MMSSIVAHVSSFLITASEAIAQGGGGSTVVM